MIPDTLLQRLKQAYTLEWNGIHGYPHWQRVCRIGQRLSQKTGADSHLVTLFTFCHDIKRENNSHDPEHGARAAAFIRRINSSHLLLPKQGLDMLTYACREHSNGHTDAHPTIQTCWDADRLDLGRVDITPRADFLCTPSAKDPGMIAWARSLSAPVA